MLRAELGLLLQDKGGVWKPETFRVDSGTEMTTMPAALARSLDLPVPRYPVRGGLMISGTMREVRPGLIRARVAGMDATEYVLPCYFVGDPDASFDPNRPPTLARNILGLSGVVDRFRFIFDGTPAPDGMHGLMIIEKL